MRSIIGLTQTFIFVLFSVFQVLLVISQRQVMTSYYSQSAMKNQLFNTGEPHIEFANTQQMYKYMFDVLSK